MLVCSSLFYICSPSILFLLFFFNDTPTTEIYTLSLHDALPISQEVLLEGLDSTFATMRKSGKSEMPPVFFDSLTGRIRRVVPQLIDSLATVYARQLSVADLKDLVQFYESPLGQRYSKAQVAFQLQSSEMAKRWGMRLALDVMKDLIDKGLISDLGNR